MNRMVLAMLVLAPAMASAKPADKPEAAADKQDRIVCKTTPQIGSLVATDKVCQTKRQWERERSNLSMRDPLGSCNGPGGEASSMSGGFCGTGH